MADRGTPTGTPRWVWVFGIIGVVVVLLVVIALVTGLGGPGGHGPGRHIPSGNVGSPTPTSVVGGPAEADKAARRIQVTALDTMAFEPKGLSVSAGETVTFVVANPGNVVHEFTIGDAVMQQEHAMIMAHIPAGMGHDTPNSVTLQPGETKELTWQFGGAETMEYACHEPGHYEAGMRGQITIN